MQVCKQPSAIHENILVFYKNQPTYNDLKFKVDEKYIDKRKSINDSFYSNGHYSGVMKRKADDGLRHPQSILPFNSVWKKGMHPTEKPVELFEWLIKSYTNENDIVLDNCAGSCTTAIASLNTNRGYICMEKDEKYYNIGLKRVKEWYENKNSKLF
jgi:site-specific DNA-methyltransferase (adenine-specific)